MEDSDQGSCVGRSPERWEVKRLVMSVVEVGSPQRARASAGEAEMEVGEYVSGGAKAGERASPKRPFG